MMIQIAKPYLTTDEAQAVYETVLTGWITQGPKVQEFEECFAEYVGAQYAVAMTSCTTALHAALAVSGVGPGDEVIIPSLSFIATANTVVNCGATPVFVDIDPATCNIDPGQIEAAITKRTKVLMPVHQMGWPVELDVIQKIATKYHLLLIEDAVCAIGSAYKEKRIGGHGNLACFSFHPRKVITTGEGGMITTDDAETAQKLRMFRHHGMSISDLDRHQAQKVMIEHYPTIGYNYRMTDMQAAMGIIQMQKLPQILEKRRAIAQQFNEAFSHIPCLRVPLVPDYVAHNYQSYWVEVLEDSPRSRDALMQSLLEQGIATRRGIMAIHQEPCYLKYCRTLPQTERITATTLILPLYPSMTTDEVQYVTKTLKRALLG